MHPLRVMLEFRLAEIVAHQHSETCMGRNGEEHPHNGRGKAVFHDISYVL